LESTSSFRFFFGVAPSGDDLFLALVSIFDGEGTFHDGVRVSKFGIPFFPIFHAAKSLPLAFLRTFDTLFAVALLTEPLRRPVFGCGVAMLTDGVLQTCRISVRFVLDVICGCWAVWSTNSSANRNACLH